MSLFLRCLGEAIAARGMRGLVEGIPFGGLVYDVAADVIDRYRQQNRLRQLSSDLEQVIQAEARDLRIEIAEVAEQAAAGKAEIARQIESYLLQVPAVVQRSLRRPEDPRGTTVPAAAKLDDPAQLAALLPQRLPRFRAGQPVPSASGWVLDRLLGSGGFGEVWLATHPVLRGFERAYKFCLDPDARERLLRHEGDVIQRVMRASKAVTADQQGIVPLLDAYLDGETPWLAYEYIDGGDLAGLVKASQAQNPLDRGRTALTILQRLAAIVGELHRLPEPVIHRDLKPANVLVRWVGSEQVLRVTDFGIGHVAADRAIRQATISTPQACLGGTLRGAHSPLYASPQQKRGHKPDVRDDVHALGVIGFQLLLADLQAERPSGLSWRRKVAASGLSDHILDLLGRCWDDDPADRPADAKELADLLAAAPPERASVRPVPPTPARLSNLPSWGDEDVPSPPPAVVPSPARPAVTRDVASAKPATPLTGNHRALVAALSEVAGGKPFGEVIATLKPPHTDDRVAYEVGGLLLKYAGRLSAPVVRAVAAWADGVTQTSLLKVSAADLDDGGRGQAGVATGPAFAEVPGLRVKDQLIWPPQLVFPDTSAGRVALYGWQKPAAGLRAADVVALAAGHPAPSFDGAAAVLAWADQPDHPAHDDAREVVAAGVPGVQEVPAPGAAGGPRFVEVRKLYRGGLEGHLWTLTPALVHAATGRELRAGRAEVGAGNLRPAVEQFMADEADAVVDEVRSRPGWEFECAEGTKLAACRPADLRARLDGRIRDFGAARTRADVLFATATSFANFAQDVLRVVLVRGAAADVAAWRARQGGFRRAIKVYYREFELREESPVVYEHYARWMGQYECVRVTRAEPGVRNGAVTGVVAPRLVYAPMAFALKGTLFYFGS